MVRLAALLLVVFPAVAFAVDTGNTRDGFKGHAHVGLNPGTPDSREGGETVADAFVIPGLPFVDTGNTSDNINDYDEVCPFQGSTAPDVVYAFTPTMDLAINLGLCSNNNQYDTKIYMYQDSVTPGSPWACNDDYCANDWTYYASFLWYVTVHAGHTYFIVIDGYGGDAGNYELEVAECLPCGLECPENAVPEGEPPLVDWYVDEYNGGCNSSPTVFQDINWVNQEDGCAWLCGVSGWYYAGASYRDTDWFPIVASGEQLKVTITAEFQTRLYVMYPPDCNIPLLFPHIIVDPCIAGTISYPTSPGMEIWLWVGPNTFSGPVYEYTYFLHVCGIMWEVLPTENSSWGALKALYR